MPNDYYFKGFNLLNLFVSREECRNSKSLSRCDGNFSEEEIGWIAEWGFNFIRIPMSYRNWVCDARRMDVMSEAVLEKIDRVVELGNKNGMHVSLNMHRAPGYCINHGLDEPFDLWKDREARELFISYWSQFARRYRGISPDMLSFDLLNEPPAPDGKVMTEDRYVDVMKETIGEIRRIDPDRLIMAEGLSVGNDPVAGLIETGVMQCCRAYIPFGLSHYKAPWTGIREWEMPEWPGAKQGGISWDRSMLEKHYSRWAELREKGICVHCGEGGAYIHTPHDVVLRWMEDVLDILKKNGIGLSLWEFSGDFGILDSGRADVDYEDWHGRRLDRRMLDLLKKY